MTQPRADWHTYFMNIARQVATRSTCDRKQVGAVIVRDRTILSTGYNGSIRGLAHCDEAGHLMENGHCVRTVHAESNAVAQSARSRGAHRRGGNLHHRQPLLELLQTAGQFRGSCGSTTGSFTAMNASRILPARPESN